MLHIQVLCAWHQTSLFPFLAPRTLLAMDSSAKFLKPSSSAFSLRSFSTWREGAGQQTQQQNAATR
jgi:hypothetical protein